MKYKSKLVGLGATLLTVLTLAASSTSSNVVYATDTEPEADTVTTTIGDRKIVEDMIKLDASKLDGANSDTMASVVEGADGLMYVVANPEGELVYDENEVDYSKDLLDKIKTGNVGANDHTTGAIEVGIDKERQKEADAADTGVKDFDEVDYNDIEDLQSALNDDDFPFIEDEEYEKAMDEAKSVSEQEEIFAQTPVFFASRILTMTQNFNDVPTVMKSSSAAIMAAASSSLSKPGTIYPPSGYGWIFITNYGNSKAFTYDRYYYTTISGTPAFCIEAGVPHGTTYTKSSTTSPITQTQLNNVAALIAAWHARGGWTNNTAGYTRYIGTQLAIWDWTNNKLGTVLLTPNWKASINENRKTMKDIANSIKIAPTYDKTSTTVSKGSNAVFTIKRGATFRAAGKDHVLGVSANNGATVSLSGTKITVNTSNVAAGKTVTVTVKKGYNKGAYNTPQVWNSGSKQKMASGRFVITQKLTVKVRAKGRVQVTKTDATSGAKLSGAKFRFSYSGTSREVTTNANGVALLPVDLDEGTTVTVVETAAPAGYQLNSSSFTIKASNNPSRPTNTTRTNARSVGSLKVIKTGDLDGKRMQNAKFTIYKSDQKTVQTTVTTNSNGEAQVNNLPLGTYYAKETTAPVGYHLNTTMHKLTVTASTTSSAPATVTVSNAYIKPTVTKTVTDANESAKTSNTWTAATSDFLQYDLKTSVIRKSGQHNLSSLVITDNYDKDRLDVSKVEVFQGSTNVTSQFTTSTNTSTGVITATAKAASLTNASFYDKAYTVRTTMKLKNAIRTGSSSSKAQISMSKSGSIAIKGTATSSNSSNAVTTILPVATVTATHNLSTKNGSAYTKIATLNTAATKYYYGENYSVSKRADGKYATSTTTYYYQYDTASGAATRTGTVTGNTNLTFQYVPITIGSPTKTVSDSDQSNVTSNTMTLSETITYRVNQSLPASLSGIKITSFSFEDTIDSRYTIVSKKVMQGSTDVTSQFTDGSSGNAIKFTAKAANLASTAFYGKTYTLQVQVKIATSKIPSGSSKATQTISNTGTVKFDNISRTTNTTTTSLPVYTMTYKHTLVPTASASATPIATLASGSDKYYRGENYSYTKRADGRQTISGTLYYINFISSLGNTTYSGTATANGTFNFYYLGLTNATPTKTVSDSDQTNVTSNTINATETYTYKINHAVASGLSAVKFGSYVLTDTINPNLDIVSKRVIDSSGAVVTSRFTDGSSGNTVKYTATSSALNSTAFYGTTYTLEIKVKVKTSSLKTDNTKTALSITNNATLAADGVTKTTNTTTTNLPVYTMTGTHRLVPSATSTANPIGTLSTVTTKYYRGQTYTMSKRADGRVTFNNTVYYYNFATALGNATYTGTATADASFNFYYAPLTIAQPTKTVSDNNEVNKVSNTLEYGETFTYKVNHTLQSQLGTAKFGSYVITDTVSSNLDIVSKRIINSAGTDVTSKFTDGTSGNNVKYTAKSAELANTSFYGTTYTLEIKVKVKASAMKTDNTKTELTFTNKATFVHDNVSKTTNTVTSKLPVYTLNYTHTLLKSNTKTDTIGSLGSGSAKYYNGQPYTYSKLADTRVTLNGTLYYYNFISSLGNATYTGKVTKNDTFNFYYLSIVVNTPTKRVTDSDQTDVTSNTLLYNETFTYKVKHTLQKELGTAKFASYSISDTVPSTLDIVSKRIINSAGTDVTTKFTDGTSGNAVKYTAKTAELAKADFYGTTYTLEIKVKVKSSAMKTDNTKTALNFTNTATFVHDNVSKSTNRVTSNLPVYTMNYKHTLVKSNSKTDTIGTLKSGSDKYYRGQSYKYDKMADGRQTLNSVLYYFNFIPSFGNASYSGTATSNQSFDFYYLSIVVNTPTKRVTDSDQKDVTSNTLLYNETYTYNMKHTLQKELGTARFASYVLTDAIDSKLTIVSKRVINSAGTDVTRLFTDNSAGNTVKFTAKTAELAKASFYGTTYTVEIKVKVATSALKTDKSKEALTFTNSATFVHDNVTKTTNTVTSNLPVYTMTYGHSLLKTAKTSDLIGSMKSGSDKYYRGQAYKYDKMADGRITLGRTLYYYNFIPGLGNASYSGTATSNQTFNFYYLSIVVNTPTKTVTDSNQTNVTTNQIKAYEQFKYSVKHVVQQQLATAKFGTYVLQDTVDSRLTVVSSRILDGSGNNVTSWFDNKTRGNTVQYEAKAASLNAASFYNKTYNLEITVKVSDATLNAAGSGKRTFTMPNTGRLTHDGVVKNTGTTNTTLPAYRITINHKDVKTDAQLAQDIDYKYDGENYRYNPRTDLYDTDTPKNNYKSQTVHTGTINGRDITLETLYHIPVYTVNVDTIRIDTAKAGTGGALPVQLTLSEYKEYPDELDKIRYAITVTDTTNSNRVVYTRNMTVANFASTLNFTVPSNYLTKNSKVNYRVSIAPTANPEENDFNTQSGAVTTHGYTSSEKVLTNSDLVLNRIDYSAVIRTFKERTRSTVQEYKERIVYDFTPEERSKTGYGFDINLDLTYTNELNRQATIDLSIVSPLAMIKGDTKNGIDSYLIDQYPAVGSTVTIPLERMSLANTTSAGTRRMVYDFELPHINIEPKTGILFTDEQVAAPHAAIQDPTAVMVDGGRQFYVPIWTDLGDYDIFVRSNNTFGDNLIRINMNKDIDVYAYMYGTIDSDTIDDDELVVEPVYPDTEMPDDWDDDEKDWVLNP